MPSHGRLTNLLLSFAIGLSAVGCSGDTGEVEQVVLDYVAALKKDDRATLKTLLTPEMYESYEDAAELRSLSKELTGAALSPDELELVSLSTDKIEGDTAYMNAEIRHGNVSRFERVVLKRLNSRWRVAGKQ